MNTKSCCICKKALALVICCSVMLSLPAFSARAQQTEQTQSSFAQCISALCEYSTTDGSTYADVLRDGSLSTTGRLNSSGKQYWEISTGDQCAQGLYIKWETLPEHFTLCVDTGSGFDEPFEYTPSGCYQEYIELPADCAAVRIQTQDGLTHPLRAYEITVYGEGDLPEEVHRWSPTASSAELMVISAHQDDEVLYFGGTLPYYSGELLLDTVVVYMALGERYRIHEALDGLWVCGVRQNPIFLGLEDIRVGSIDSARLYWDEHQVIDTLSALLKQYRPQVVVSHDEAGEYGHGQHILTTYCVEQAILSAATGSDAWDVPKCYLHLYEQGRIFMPWGSITLERLGNITALEAAKRGYEMHVSQHIYDYVVDTGEYDCRLFGLWRSTVGNDVEGDDFFENIDLRIVNAHPPEDIHPSLTVSLNNPYVFMVKPDAEIDCPMVRYGTISGVTGWFAADETGIPVFPAQQVALLQELPVQLPIPHSIEQVNDISGLYRYAYSENAQPVYIRYGTVDGIIGWYETDESGVLCVPVKMLELQSDMTVDHDAQSSSENSILIICAAGVFFVCLLTITALLRRTAHKWRRKASKRSYWE